MDAFTTHTGLAVPLNRPNIDTDQLIPKQFGKRSERTGFGQFLLFNWRYDATGQPNPDFILNFKRYQGASVLLAAKNFGSGSSREHAVWALMDYGFRTVIAPSFGDIFYNNCFKNGMLPVVLPESEVEGLIERATTCEGYQLSVDLATCSVSDQQGFHAQFQIEPFRRYCLLNGLDDIALTLEHEEKIARYEAKRKAGFVGSPGH